MHKSETVDSELIITHLRSLLFSSKVPILDADLAGREGVKELHEYLVELRRLLDDYSKGDFSREIKLRGIFAGQVKTFQANMLHLIWQIQQVAKGDFSQRIDFLGDFAVSFNSMIVQLDHALSSLRQKEEELIRLTRQLETEVELRGRALKELSISEARFRYLAEHDPLTSILNRRSFFALAEMALTQAGTQKESCCVAIFDIDHFKSFNDSHGHLQGDEAIRHVVKKSQLCLRHNDLIGRYGGEEFVLLLAHVDEKQGINVAERIRSTIEKSPLIIGGQEVTLTVSIGLVEVPPGRYNSEDHSALSFLLAVADAALYNAKRDGRNLTRSAPLADF